MLAVTIRPPFGERANAVMARSISPASRMSMGRHLHPERWRHCLDDTQLAAPAVNAGSRRTAARVTPGAICLSSSSHFPPMLYSNEAKPVILPPGRAKLATKPPLTGSTTVTSTIGTVGSPAATLDARTAVDEDDMAQRDQSARIEWDRHSRAPAIVDLTFGDGQMDEFIYRVMN